VALHLCRAIRSTRSQTNLTFVGCRAFGQGFLPTNATPDVAIGYPFLGGGGPRDIQLALKFTF